MRLIILLVVIAVGTGACGQGVLHSDARESLGHGVEAFKVGHYDEAVRDFQAAVDAEPEWLTARLYLATALSHEVVPNLETPENLAVANRALDQFNVILEADPQNLDVLRQVAAIQRNIKRFDDAIATERKIIGIDPKDAGAHYTIGVIEWTNTYLFAVQTLGEESLQDDGVGNVRLSAAGCTALAAHNAPLVNDAIAELTRAVEIQPTHDDAMQYLNLAYRRKADLACGHAAEREKDLATAKEWVQRAVAARKANEQQKMREAGSGPIR